jgi:hypothetical protein
MFFSQYFRSKIQPLYLSFVSKIDKLFQIAKYEKRGFRFITIKLIWFKRTKAEGFDLFFKA